MKLPEINDMVWKGKVLCFPKTIVKYHIQTNVIGDLKLTIHKSITFHFTPYVPLKEMLMYILSEHQRNLDAIQHPSLGPLPHHSQGTTIILRAIISKRINQREIRWGSALSSRGLPKFWEWSVWIHELLFKQNLTELISTIYSAMKEYPRLNSMYIALLCGLVSGHQYLCNHKRRN
ncbi:hypothetical protein Adt_39301 [Abeliophyllum distichum]|uniref:Uncharacterized protein n=1 Tax=Abeliophyllum distichum TaxID=126358 RepID=A0ABD1Q4Q0_9LAMI